MTLQCALALPITARPRHPARPPPRHGAHCKAATNNLNQRLEATNSNQLPNSTTQTALHSPDTQKIVPEGYAGAGDWAVQLVESSPSVRRALAFPVAFVSSSNWLAQCIYVATKLRIPDMLADGPLTVEELASKVEADPGALSRLVRSLAGQGPIPGLFVEVFDTPFGGISLPLPPAPFPFSMQIPNSPLEELQRKYALTPLGAMLREQGTDSIRPWTLFSGEELGRGWGGLLHAVQSGTPAFGKAQGGDSVDLDFWGYMERFPEAGATFDASMQALSAYAMSSGEAADQYDWAAGKSEFSVVDVGGGTGSLLANILSSNPKARGILFDQEQVVAGASSVLREAGVEIRCELVSGSFFDEGAIPADQDVYVMKNIIHDWDDELAIQILRRVAQAMRHDSRLVLLEVVRSARDGYEPWVMDFVDFYDLNMLVTVGGKERSRAEWQTLLDAAGLDLTEVTGTTFAGSLCSIEARLRPALTARIMAQL